MRVVYKPRSLAVDRHFHELVAWINARGQTPPLRAVQAISVDDHGWAEFVANTPCATRDGGRALLRAFGAYLAVLHALNATDFHYENVIASGEYPMLDRSRSAVSSASRSRQPDRTNRSGSVGRALQASVLRTGVLPVPRVRQRAVEWSRHERHGRCGRTANAESLSGAGRRRHRRDAARARLRRAARRRRTDRR